MQQLLPAILELMIHGRGRRTTPDFMRGDSSFRARNWTGKYCAGSTKRTASASNFIYEQIRGHPGRTAGAQVSGFPVRNVYQALVTECQLRPGHDRI